MAGLMHNIFCRPSVGHTVPEATGARWGSISGDIEKQQDLIDYINSHGSSGRGYNFKTDVRNNKVSLDITLSEVENLLANNVKTLIVNDVINAITYAVINSKTSILVTEFQTRTFYTIGKFVGANSRYWTLNYDATNDNYVGEYTPGQTNILNFATLASIEADFLKKTGIKTINNQSLVGSGNIEVNAGLPIIYEDSLVTILDDLKVEGYIKAPNNTIEAKKFHATSSSIFDSGVTINGRLTVNGITQNNSGASNYFEGKSVFKKNLVPEGEDVNLGNSDSSFNRGYINELITDSIKCPTEGTSRTVIEFVDGEAHIKRDTYVPFDCLFDSNTDTSLFAMFDALPIHPSGDNSGVQATGDTHTNYAEYSNSLALGVCSVVSGDRGFGVGTGIQAIYLTGSDTLYTIDYITNNERWSTMVNYIDPELFRDCILYDADFKPVATVIGVDGGNGAPIVIETESELGSVSRKRFFLSTRTGASVVNFGSNIADGRQSLVSGLANYNSAQYSNVFGAWNVNSNTYSSVLGYSNDNEANGGVVMGMYNLNQSTTGGVVLGHSNENSGNNSIIIGLSNTSYDSLNTVLGSENFADCEETTIIGNKNRTDSSWNTLVGYGLRSELDLKTVVGRYNDPDDDGAMFVVGVGVNDDERKNGLVIYSDGTILGQDGKHVTYTEDVEKLIAPTTPNIIVYGNPTIANGRISQFSANSYAQFPFLVDLKDKDFSIEMNITTGANVTTQQNILDSSFGLAFAIRNGQFVLALSYDGTSWSGEHTGGTVTANTTYDIAILKAGATYAVMTSTDNKKTWQYPIIFDEQRSPYPRTVIIGKDTTGRYPFAGSIDLNKCLLSVNSQYVWRGMGDVGLLTRLDTSLSNIDAEGVEYIKSLGGGGKINPITFAEYEALTDKSGVYFVIPDSL